MRQSLPRWAAAVLAAVLLAGCAAVPTSGPVVEHDFADQQVDSSVQVAPVPPAPGASAMLVVEGFLHAMGNDQVGYPVARQYLTEAANKEWCPESGTTVYADGFPPTETDESIFLTAPTTGMLSDTGEYTETTGQLRQDFGLVQDSDDQWRISKPPTGLLISRYHFTTNYAAVNLHYPDNTGTALVPDPRFFARNDALLITVLRAQLGGPSGWIGPSVQRLPGTPISGDRAEVSGVGLASVYLSAAAATLATPDRTNLLAALTFTLTELPQVTGVQVTSAGRALPLPGTATTVLTTQMFPGIAPADQAAPGRLYAVRGGQVAEVSTGTSWVFGTALPGLADVGKAAVSADLSEVAAVSLDGTTLTTAPMRAAPRGVLVQGTGLLRPAYSRQKELWVLGDGADGSGFKVFAQTDLTPREFHATSIPEMPVRAFRISPDGARMALVLDGQEVDQVGIARIVRFEDEVWLQDFHLVSVGTSPQDAQDLLDVGWTTATQLLVLVSHGQQVVSIVRIDQDSARSDDIGPSEATGLLELAVVPGRQAVVRDDAAVFRYEGDFSWRPALNSVDGLAYSG